PDAPVPAHGAAASPPPQCPGPTHARTYYRVPHSSPARRSSDLKSGCADEPVAIAPAQTAIATTQDPASGTVGDTFKDKAKLSGLVRARARGSSSRIRYSNESCGATEDGLVASERPVAVDGDGEY